MEKQANNLTQPEQATKLSGWGHISQTGLRFVWIALLGLIIDQFTKHAVVDVFNLYESVQVTSFFNLTYVHNYGAAFSFLSDAGGWQRWFFTVVSAVVSVVLAVWIFRLRDNQRLLALSLALILGGAIGNLIDRVLLGYVVDFISVHYQQRFFPAFNIADSAISVGAVLMIADMFIHPENHASEKAEAK